MIPPALASDAVTWIQVPPQRLDVVGLILGSLGLTAAFALVALVLGAALGVALIRRGRSTEWAGEGPLHLGLTPPPS